MGTIRRVWKSWRAKVRRKDFYWSANFSAKQYAREAIQEVETSFLAGKRGRPRLETFGDAMRKFVKEVSPTRSGPVLRHC